MGVTPEPPPRGRSPLSAIVLLTAVSGATDAVSFLGLGGVFTANMTGNLVLVGLVGRPDYGPSAIRAAAACVAFAIGLAIGFRATHLRGRHRHGHTLRNLLVSAFALQAVFLVGWLICHEEPGRVQELLLVILSSAAMGLQTSASRLLVGGHGITTTFVTGTMTSLLEDASRGKHEATAARSLALLALPVGALLGATALLWVRPLAPVLPLLGLLAALLLLVRSERGARNGPPPAG